MALSFYGTAAARPPLTLHPVWPFVVALAATVAFGLLAARSDQNWVLWAIGGGAFALAAATIVSGIANSVALPYTVLVIYHHQEIAAAVSVALVTLLALLLALLPRVAQ